METPNDVQYLNLANEFVRNRIEESVPFVQNVELLDCLNFLC